MKNNEKLYINGLHQIRVNKKPKAQNFDLNNISNDIKSFNENYKTNNFITKTIFTKIPNNDRQNNFSSSQNKINNRNIYNEISHPLSTSHKDIKFKKIIINKNNKNESRSLNKQEYINYMINSSEDKNQLIEEDINGKKLLICRSETQYPLSFRKDDNDDIIVNENNSKQNSNNVTPNPKDINLRYFTISPKNGIKQRIENRNNNYQIYNNENNNNQKHMIYDYNNSYNVYRKNEFDNYYNNEIMPNMTYNNFGHNIYQPINEQINNNTNYFYNNNENAYFDDMNYTPDYTPGNNFVNYRQPQNLKYMSQSLNNRNDIVNQEYIQIFKRNNNINNNYNILRNKNMSNEENGYGMTPEGNEMISEENNNYSTMKNDYKDKELIKIYKGKLIKIFIQFMTNFYFNHSKRIFDELIMRLRKNKNSYDNLYLNINRRYQKKRFNKGYDENKNNNFYYIKKNNFKYSNNNNNNNNFQYYESNLFNSCTSHKKVFSMNIDNKIDKMGNSNIDTNIANENILYNSKERHNNYFKEKEENLKNNSSNIYIPAKNRNISNNYKSHKFGSKPKESIFNEIKIYKSPIKDKNNFYNTNFCKFYPSKNDDFNPIINQENQRSKYILLKNNPKSNNITANLKEQSNINVQPIFYKKLASQEKNLNKDINIYKKKTEKINKNKNRHNNDINKNSKNNYMRNDMFKTQYFNCSNSNEINANSNNITNISNDLNNYCLDDKPMNMIYLKNSNMDIEDENLVTSGGNNNINKKEKSNNNIIYKRNINDSFEIKNLIQMKSEDKRLFLNFNYCNFSYNIRNNKRNKAYFVFSKINSLYIPYTNKKIENELNNMNHNYSFKDSTETINTNLNRYVKKRKLKSGVLKLDNIISNKIFENKCIFFSCLKRNKLYCIFSKIIYNLNKNKIKKYFEMYKKKIFFQQNLIEEKKQMQKPLKNITIDCKLDNNFINFDEINNPNSEFNLKIKKINKLKGKFRYSKNKYKNKIEKNNTYDSDNEEKNNLINNSFEEEKRAETNVNIPLWKSSEFYINSLNLNLTNNRQKTVYSKKKIKPTNLKINI